MATLKLPEDIQATISAFPRKLSRSFRGLTQPSIYLPSFLARPDSTPENTRVSPTAWLDGMRGIAALLVYFRHFGAIHHPDIQVGYGANESNHYLIQLPFLRLLTAGPAMVAMFFIISGYALSWAPLRALHVDVPGSSRRENSMTRLSSGTFRRAFRLFAPGVVSTFLILICVYLGLYEWGDRALNTPGDIPGFQEPQPPIYRNHSFYYQFLAWYRATWSWTHILSGTKLSNNHVYNPHLWTLQTEWQCSIALFVVLLALTGTRVYLRLVVLISMVVYCQYINNWPNWLFFAGAALAQLKLIQEDNFRRNNPKIEPLLGEKQQDESKETQKHLSMGDHVRIAIFIMGLYLLSAPDYDFATWAPGYGWLSQLNPPEWPENWRFLHCVGGVMAVYAVSSTHTHMLRSIFDNKYSRYLGKISYALYLVHGPIVHMLGFWLVPFFWRFTGNDNMIGKEVGWFMAFAIQTTLVIWAADLFWRGVDSKCVNLAKTFESLVRDKDL